MPVRKVIRLMGTDAGMLCRPAHETEKSVRETVKTDSGRDPDQGLWDCLRIKKR